MSKIRILLAAIIGGCIGGIWGALDNGDPWGPWLLVLILAAIAYGLAHTVHEVVP